MAAPRNWRQLKRHPLSAEYSDLTGKAFAGFVENVRENGILNRRKVTLFEGKVLDGWQLLRACIEIGTPPEFQQKPKNIRAEDFVSAVNDHRRHETQDVACKRAADRRARVIEARGKGESIRTIAAQENVSTSTVIRDLEAAEQSGVTPVTPDTVEGKDGKEYPAKTKEEIFCKRCMRVGPRPNCGNCKEARDAHMKVRREKKKSVRAIDYDWKRFDTCYAVVAQFTDRIPEVYPTEKGCEELKEIERLFREAVKNIAKLRTRIMRS